MRVPPEVDRLFYADPDAWARAVVALREAEAKALSPGRRRLAEGIVRAIERAVVPLHERIATLERELAELKAKSAGIRRVA
jgi:hypothetical protein